MAGEILKFNVRHDLNRLTRGLDDFARKQVPFAAAQAINATALEVQQAETAHIKEVFPTATPFTQKAVGLQRARKDRLDAVIFLKDIAAGYLGPYIDGGRHKLNSRALLNPKDIAVNQYGNIPRGKLQALKGRADIFIGSVSFKKSGETISGVWQRVTAKAPPHAAMVAKLGKRARATVAKAIPSGPRSSLKLLIRFGDALPVKERLDWGDTAQEIVAKSFDRNFAIALSRALSTAKP